jgi:hypothetical protein
MAHHSHQTRMHQNRRIGITIGGRERDLHEMEKMVGNAFA